MEIHEVVRFHHSQVKFVTLQELHAYNTRKLMRNSNKICEQLQRIKTSVKFELSCTVATIIAMLPSRCNITHAYVCVCM